MRYKVSGAIAASWEAKAGVNPPFAGRERPFSLRRTSYLCMIRPAGDVLQPCRIIRSSFPQASCFIATIAPNKQLFYLFLHRFQLTYQAIQLAGDCPRVPILLNPILGQPTHPIPYAIQYRCKRGLFLQRRFQSQQQFRWWVCPEKSPLHV